MAVESLNGEFLSLILDLLQGFRLEGYWHLTSLEFLKVYITHYSAEGLIEKKIEASVSDPYSSNPDSDPAKNLNPDPDPSYFLVSYHYLKFFVLLHNYKIFYKKTECCKSH